MRGRTGAPGVDGIDDTANKVLRRRHLLLPISASVRATTY